MKVSMILIIRRTRASLTRLLRGILILRYFLSKVWKRLILRYQICHLMTIKARISKTMPKTSKISKEQNHQPQKWASPKKDLNKNWGIQTSASGAPKLPRDELLNSSLLLSWLFWNKISSKRSSSKSSHKATMEGLEGIRNTWTKMLIMIMRVILELLAVLWAIAKLLGAAWKDSNPWSQRYMS